MTEIPGLQRGLSRPDVTLRIIRAGGCNVQSHPDVGPGARDASTPCSCAGYSAERSHWPAGYYTIRIGHAFYRGTAAVSVSGCVAPTDGRTQRALEVRGV